MVELGWESQLVLKIFLITIFTSNINFWKRISTSLDLLTQTVSLDKNTVNRDSHVGGKCF